MNSNAITLYTRYVVWIVEKKEEWSICKTLLLIDNETCIFARTGFVFILYVMALVCPSFNFLRTYMQFCKIVSCCFSIVLYVYNYSQYLWWLRYLQLTDIHFLALVLTYPLSSKQIEVNTYCDEKILNEFFDLKTKFFFHFFLVHTHYVLLKHIAFIKWKLLHNLCMN